MPKQRTEQRLQNGTCSWISCMQVDSGGEEKKRRCWGGGERWREGASREKKVGKKTIKTKKTKGEQGEYEEKFFSVRSGECCRESQEGERQRQRERDSLKEKRKWRAAMKRYKEQDVHTRM